MIETIFGVFTQEGKTNAQNFLEELGVYVDPPTNFLPAMHGGREGDYEEIPDSI
jgi:hypothetical protein